MLAVRLFASARDLLGRDRVTLDCMCPCTIAELREQLIVAHPALAALAVRSRFAHNGDFATDDAQVQAGDELALIPPVSGG